MDGAGIAAKVAFGYAKAGSKLGLPHTLFRPSAALTPALAPQNRVQSLLFVSSNTADASFKQPSKYGNPIRFGLFDSRLTRVGDYVDGGTGTYFIASAEVNGIPMVVQCNATISVLRPGDTPMTGVPLPGIQTTYGGRTTATDEKLLTQWPASVLDAGRTEAGRADLPGDVPMKGVMILLPAWPGLVIRTSDRVTDDQGRAFTTSGCELTELGWRISAALSEG